MPAVGCLFFRAIVAWCVLAGHVMIGMCPMRAMFHR
jgi:hypothetical protein